MKTSFPIPSRQHRSNAPALRRPSAFTLIELLTVISIMAILAALVFTATTGISKQKILKRARAELTQVQTAIGWYKDELGHYPPDNPGLPSTNQLYYELLGTKLVPPPPSNPTAYQTLDGSAQIDRAAVNSVFNGISGFANSTRGTGGDEGHHATIFFKGLKAGQFLAFTTFSTVWSALGSTILDGPSLILDGTTGHKINPWCYNSSNPVKNPNSYDLWMDVKVGSTVYRMNNWSTTPLVNPPPYPN